MIEIRPVRRLRLYEEIVAQLHEAILHGEIAPGGRLPSERDLAHRFRVSRVSVRQALAVLHAMGLVEIRSGGGVFAASVARCKAGGVAAVLASQRDMTRAHLEVRLIIEPRVSALAAQRATDEDVRAMARALEEQTTGMGMPARDLDLAGDAHFHTAIAEATKNPLLVKMVEVMIEGLKASREASARTPGGPARAVKEHRRILRAIRRRNPEAAERAMRLHLLTVERLASGVRPAEMDRASAVPPAAAIRVHARDQRPGPTRREGAEQAARMASRAQHLSDTPRGVRERSGTRRVAPAGAR